VAERGLLTFLGLIAAGSSRQDGASARQSIACDVLDRLKFGEKGGFCRPSATNDALIGASTKFRWANARVTS
jgi:hypothetical protein